MDIIDVIKSGKFFILDTETTGLDRAEICQIAIINPSGYVMLDSLICTKLPVPESATRIHGITDAMVRDKPTFPDLIQPIWKILSGHDVIVYNAVFDRKMLHQSAKVWGLPKTEWEEISRWHCAMEAFAEIYGDWNDYHQSYRWQKLETAARFYGIPQIQAHTALSDCLVTLEVCKAMAKNHE